MAMKIVNVCLPEEMLNDIDKVLKAEHRNRSDFFREAARHYLEERRRRRRLQNVPLVGRETPEQERAAWQALTSVKLAEVWNHPEEVDYDL